MTTSPRAPDPELTEDRVREALLGVSDSINESDICIKTEQSGQMNIVLREDITLNDSTSGGISLDVRIVRRSRADADFPVDPNEYHTESECLEKERWLSDDAFDDDPVIERNHSRLTEVFTCPDCGRRWEYALPDLTGPTLVTPPAGQREPHLPSLNELVSKKTVDTTVLAVHAWQTALDNGQDMRGVSPIDHARDEYISHIHNIIEEYYEQLTDDHPDEQWTDEEFNTYIDETISAVERLYLK